MRVMSIVQVMCTFIFLAPAFGQYLLNDFDVTLPQVAKGVQGAVAIETTIIVVNPNTEPVTAMLTSSNESRSAYDG